MNTSFNNMVPRFDFVAIDIEYADSAQHIYQVGLVVSCQARTRVG